MMICCLLPIIVIYAMGAMGVVVNPLLLLLIMILCWLSMARHMSHGCHAHEDGRQHADQKEVPATSEGRQEPLDTSAIIGNSHARQFGEVRVVDGELLTEPEAAFERVKQQLSGQDITPVMQEDEYGQARLVLLPGSLEDSRPNRGPTVHALLFIATIATTTWAGALHQGVNLLEEPGRFMVGLPYSLTLMLILGAHELGHYFAARSHGVKVTLPYFIPVPFALGTFGAFISMKSLPPNRRALFDVAVAGPLAGLVFAIPALWVGLQKSQIVDAGTEQTMAIMHHGTEVGSSVLLAFIAKLSLGDAISQGHQLVLHPLAFAGWLGLIVTALNLLPIGQLDGGHISDALFGIRRSATISTVALFALFFLGLFVWSGLLMWALIAFFLAGNKGIASQNDLVPLDFGRRALGVVSFVILFLILTPVPHAFYESMGIHCPYL